VAVNTVWLILASVVIACPLICWVAYEVYRHSLAVTVLEQWAKRAGYRVVQRERRHYFRGPYAWMLGGHIVFRVILEDHDGLGSVAWIDCGNPALSDTTSEIEWDADLPRMQFTVRRLMRRVGVAVAATLAVGFIWGIDALYHGPYATAFNRRCQRLADRAGLVGRPEGKVLQVLGAPTSVWRWWSMVNTQTRRPSPGAYLVTTYNYAPCPYTGFGMFQVHCTGGIVRNTEQLDD
jgi:hypothetical protein